MDPEALAALAEKGWIRQDDKGEWFVTDAGRQAIRHGWSVVVPPYPAKGPYAGPIDSVRAKLKPSTKKAKKRHK